MTVHLVSVGLHLLTNLKDPARFGPAVQVVRNRRGEIRGLLGGSADPVVAGGHLAALFTAGAPAGPPAALIEAVEPAMWPATVSPELQSVAAHLGTTVPLAPGDVAVLIASDTADGLLAAAWNALALTSAGNVRYGHTVPDVLDIPPGGVLILRIPGLDAASETGFRQAMRHLGTLGHRLLLHTDPAEEIRLHLSGGFKVTITYLTALAEAMRSAHDPVTAYLLHETTDRPIRVPLRCLRRTVLDDELAPFTTEDTELAKPPGTGMRILDGYAYERTPAGRYRLTGFGVGLTALLGYVPATVEGPSQ